MNAQLKKTIVKKQQSNKGAIAHLIEGANILVKDFNTPDLFLEFLSESLFWIEEYNSKNEDEEEKKSVYLIKMMISEIIMPWLMNKSDMIEKIAEGLKEINSHAGYEGYFEFISATMQGFAIYLYEGPYPFGFMRKYIWAFNTMYKIGFCIEAFENERKKENLSKAA